MNPPAAAILSLDSLTSAFGGLEGASMAFVAAFVVAGLEAFVFTTLLVPGCLMMLGMGALMATGQIHPIGCVTGVLVGMWLGDQISYLLARGGCARIGRSKVGLRMLGHLAEVGRSPARTLLIAHFCPYLSGLAPAAAGTAKVAYARFLVYDSLGVLLGTAWFLGVGAGIGVTSKTFASGLVVGVGLTVLAVVVSISLLRAVRASRRRRGFAFIFSGLCEYPVFLLQGFAYRFLSQERKQALQEQRDELAAQAQPGDILLVTRHCGGPWGKASHAAIFETSDTVIHAFHLVQRQKLSDLPLRDGFRLLRVELSPAQREAVLEYTRGQLGKKFRITTTIQHVQRENPSHFSCATLVWAAFHTVGMDLAVHIASATRWVFPRDVQSSPLTMEIRASGRKEHELCEEVRSIPINS